MKFCEHCGKLLGEEDWDYSLRGLVNLCASCKLKTIQILVTQDTAKSCITKPEYQVCTYLLNNNKE